MKSLRIVAAVAAVIISPYLHAETPSADAVIVTATRTAQTADETLASVTVITRKDIERSQPQSVLDILRTQAGIELARTGGVGNSTTLFMRGTEASHVLVLIDGVRAASATTGAFAWENLDPAQIERIEIVRGPRASIYGSDAIGGVIQIFTRQPKGVTANAEVASYQTQRLQAGYGGGDSIRYHVNASTFTTRGFSATNSKLSYFDPDDDGSRKRSANLGFEAPLWTDAKFGFSAWRNESDVEYDQGTQDSVNQTLRASLNDKFSPIWSSRIQAGRTLDDTTDYSAFPSSITSKRDSINWHNDVTLDEHQGLGLGVDYQGDSGKNVDNANGSLVFDRAIYNRAGYARWQYLGADRNLEAGLRRDDHSTFGSHNTWQLAFGQKLDEVTRLFVSHGTAFQAPTLNQLFHPGFFGFYAGNPDLKPERSRTSELGLRHRFSTHQHLQASVFQTRIQNMIAFVGVNNRAININKVSIRGFELSHGFHRERWETQTNLTLQRARNEMDDTPLLRRPDKKISFAITRSLDARVALQAEAVAVSKRRDIGNNELAGYSLINLGAHRDLDKDWRIEARAENLFDKRYELAYGYNTPGRSLSLGLRYAPDAR